MKTHQNFISLTHQFCYCTLHRRPAPFDCRLHKFPKPLWTFMRIEAIKWPKCELKVSRRRADGQSDVHMTVYMGYQKYEHTHEQLSDFRSLLLVSPMTASQLNFSYVCEWKVFASLRENVFKMFSFLSNIYSYQWFFRAKNLSIHFTMGKSFKAQNESCWAKWQKSWRKCAIDNETILCSLAPHGSEKLHRVDVNFFLPLSPLIYLMCFSIQLNKISSLDYSPYSSILFCE